MANLRGYILKQGDHVAAALVLIGKPYSAKLTSSSDQLEELRKTHGQALEQWWRGYFGHAFDRLTQSEARYLSRSPDADRIRERIVETKRPRDFQGHYRGPKAQRQRLKELYTELKQRFPDGVPPISDQLSGSGKVYGEPGPLSISEGWSAEGIRLSAKSRPCAG